MKNLVIGTFMVAALGFIGCSSIEKRPYPFSYKDLRLIDSEDSVDSVTIGQKKEDISLLQYALEKGYGGRLTIGKSSMTDLINSLEKLKATKSLKVSNICEEIGIALRAIPDNHLFARIKDGKFCGRKKLSFASVGPNLTDSDSHWTGKKLENGLYLIAIKSFPSGSWPGFFEFLDEAIGKASVIVIDLRGNGGGDDSTGMKLAQRLAGQELKVPFGPSVLSNSMETLVLWENQLKYIKRQVKDANFIAGLDKYLHENEEKMSKVKEGNLPEFTEHNDGDNYDPEEGWTYNKDLGFQGKIFILQDRKTVSSGESTINFFEFFPNVIKVGLPTRGMIHFGNLGLLVLPHTQIMVGVPTKANTYYDKRFIEKTGIQPDVLLKDGDDAFKYVLRAIQ